MDGCEPYFISDGGIQILKPAFLVRSYSYLSPVALHACAGNDTGFGDPHPHCILTFCWLWAISFDDLQSHDAQSMFHIDELHIPRNTRRYNSVRQVSSSLSPLRKPSSSCSCRVKPVLGCTRGRPACTRFNASKNPRFLVAIR